MDSWTAVPEVFRTSTDPLPPPWEELFGPLRAGRVDDLVVVGQIGQSLDGRVATATGHSHYINGPAGLAHLHRLRALVDAVVIGVGTALADDPQLTVRRVSGPQPGAGRHRSGRPASRRRQAARRRRRPPPGRDPAPAPMPRAAARHRDRRPAQRPTARSRRRRSLRRSRERGFRRVLIEGGADTVSRFLAAQCLDRLHVMVAPIILGSGRAELRAAADRRASTRRCARRCGCIGSTTRCCSIATCRLNATAGRAREHVDVTDADRGAAGRDEIAAARQPADHVGERELSPSRAPRRPSRTASRSGFRGPAGRTSSRTHPARTE